VLWLVSADVPELTPPCGANVSHPYLGRVGMPFAPRLKNKGKLSRAILFKANPTIKLTPPGSS